jgi:carnitine-CoA ligase
VMLCLSFAPGISVRPEELIQFLIPRMPHYAVPRYVRIMEELPKTPTGKLLKDELRKQGVTDDTWDREAVGIIIKRQKIGA